MVNRRNQSITSKNDTSSGISSSRPGSTSSASSVGSATSVAPTGFLLRRRRRGTLFHRIRGRKDIDPGYVIGIQTEMMDSQRRALSILSETELVGANIAISLKEQGETLARTKHLTHHIGVNLKRSDRDM